MVSKSCDFTHYDKWLVVPKNQSSLWNAWLLRSWLTKITGVKLLFQLFFTFSFFNIQNKNYFWKYCTFLFFGSFLRQQSKTCCFKGILKPSEDFHFKLWHSPRFFVYKIEALVVYRSWDLRWDQGGIQPPPPKQNREY